MRFSLTSTNARRREQPMSRRVSRAIARPCRASSSRRQANQSERPAAHRRRALSLPCSLHGPERRGRHPRRAPRRPAAIVDVPVRKILRPTGRNCPAPQSSRSSSRAPSLQRSWLLPMGPFGVGKWRNVHQRANQPQQRLMFRPLPILQECAQFDVRQPAARRRVGLMDDEGVTVLRLRPRNQVSPFGLRYSSRLSDIYICSHACRSA